MASRKEAFTPGPWSVKRQTLRSQHYGGGIIHWSQHVGIGAPENIGNTIAIVYTGGAGAASSTPETVSANARLIAAAPELYEALKAMVGDHTTGGTWRTEGDVIERARAALSKASDPIPEGIADGRNSEG